MSTKNVVFNKLFKNTARAKFSKHKTKLGVTQDLQQAVLNTDNMLQTAQKTIDIAITVNNTLEKLTEDVRFYNDYKANTYDDIGSRIEYLRELMIKAEDISSQLGLEPEFIVGYNDAKDLIVDLQSVSGAMNTHTLNFDI